MRKVLLLVPVLLLALVLASCGSSAPVTIENGSPVGEISKEKIDAWMALSRKSVMSKCKAAGGGEVAYKLCVDRGGRFTKDKVFNGMIGDAWILNEAAETNVQLSKKQERDVVREAGALKRANAGLNQSYFEERLRAQALLTVLASKSPEAAKIRVSDRQAREYYQEEAKAFALPQRRDLIVLPAQSRLAGEGIVARLKRGDSVQEILKAEGAPEAIVKRSRIRGVAAGQIPGAARKVFESEDGSIVGPINLGQDWVVIKTTRIYPQGKVPFSEAAPEIKKQLRENFIEKREIARIQDKWRPMTVCGEGYSSPLCRNRQELSPTPAS